jgi:uncharacterized protein (TIGR00369 family)
MKLNREHVEQLMQLVNASPYFQLLAMTLENVDIGLAVLKMNLSVRHLSPYGAIQGGVYASLIDAAAYWALYAELDEGIGLITLDVNINNLASVKAGELTVIGERIKCGTTIGLAEASVADENGKILAYGQSKLLMTKGLQTVDQIAKAANTTLPPKFV